MPKRGITLSRFMSRWCIVWQGAREWNPQKEREVELIERKRHCCSFAVDWTGFEFGYHVLPVSFASVDRQTILPEMARSFLPSTFAFHHS